MKIGIIGAGNVGQALAASATRAGHQVKVSAANPEHATRAAGETGARAAGSNQEAVKDAELVVLAVPADKAEEIAGGLGSQLDGKVVVDVTNRVNPQDPGQVLDGSSVAEKIQKKVPSAHVIKAFNYAFASRMANPQVDGTNLDGFVAGDDPEAKGKTLRFIESIGFRPIDAGPLPMARALEAMALLNIMLQIRNGWPWQSGWKMVGPTGEQAAG